MEFSKKVKVSVFVDPKIARAMKMQAARQGCKGVSEVVERMFKQYQQAMRAQ
jgi:hypothetical protein